MSVVDKLLSSALFAAKFQQRLRSTYLPQENSMGGTTAFGTSNLGQDLVRLQQCNGAKKGIYHLHVD